MNKVIRNNKVAVLHTNKIGAGWYTWNNEDETKDRTWMLFNPQLIEAIENTDYTLTEKITLEIDSSIYTYGVTHLSIEWVPVGCTFILTEFEGKEKVKILSYPKRLELIA